jgi:hypothetical protein
MGSFNTFNAALAKTLNGSTEDAINTLEASEAKANAEGYYLKAIIGARTSNQEMVVQNLKAAIEKDNSLKAKAKGDAEFLNYREVAEFTALVGM